MWSFGSKAIASNKSPRPNEPPCSDCSESDDEISIDNNTQEEGEGLECPICCESFNIVENVPYVLLCGHTLCKNCVLGLQSSVVKLLPSFPIHLPFFISCPWCNNLSFRILYKGTLKFPRKNYFLVWMVESLNGDRVIKSHSSYLDNHHHHPVCQTGSVGPRVHHDPPPERLHLSLHFMLVLKTLLHIGMEKIVPDKHSRRHSTGNLAFEYADVSSRYLKDPVSSCHDNCKPESTTPAPPEKSNKTPPISKRIFSQLIPKHSTKDVKTTTTSLLKPLPMEPKKQNFLKSKSKIKSTDPFYIPPSTTHRRRYSEILLPTGGLGDVLDQPPVPGLTRSRSSSKKIEPKKDPNSNSKPNSVKTLENGNISKKVQTSKPQKPVVDHGSRKSKPTKPVEEKTDETRISTSNSDERVIENDSNESQKDETLRSDDWNDESEIPSTSKKDETLRSHDQSNDGVAAASGGKKPETPRRVGKSVKENGENLAQKIKLKQGKIVDAQSSGCSTPTKHKSRQQVLDEKNQSQNQNQDDDDKRGSLRRMPSGGGLQRQGSSKLVNVVLKAQEVEKNKNKRHSGLNNVIEETASKLIQTRKSRVKALVGAFEMISESKL